MPNDYWNGTRQASLTRGQISAPWGAGDYSANRIALANRAFEIYYQAHRRISACTNGPHRNQMLTSLHDAAQTGWGLFDGVHDLEEAFEHLTDNGGRWTDSATGTYFGGAQKVFPRALTEGPVSCVNFLNAVDSNMSQLRGILERYTAQVQQISEAQRQDDWRTVGIVLSQVKDWGERAKPFLWWAPSTVQRPLGLTLAFVEVLSHIHSGLTTYANSIGAGLDSRTSIALGALRTAVGFLPVLGDFYGAAIDMVPGLRAWFQGLVQDRCRRIDAAARGRPYY